MGRYSKRPWLGYRTVRRLDALIRSDWRVLEFGSGQSTVWLARRCRALVSVESNPEWHARVTARLREARLSNVDNRLCLDQETYLALDDCRPATFDFALVDGDWRDQATKRSLELVRPGGYVLLDNSDVPLADHRAAKRLLERAAESSDGLERFVDFAPMKVAVNQALLVRIGGAP
jgi:predicted O-methyltransferase YrrM